MPLDAPKTDPQAAAGQLFTIGHSTRSAEDFRALLVEHDVKRLVDVRRFPGSRRYPHFGADALSESLGEVGIEYFHEPALGGRRTSSNESSPNTYWRSASFRAYADYMASPEFREALARLIAASQEQRTAIMCSEAVPWRCHRQLIADALSAQGFEVVDIIDARHADVHKLNPAARLQPDGTLTYPAEQRELFENRG